MLNLSKWKPLKGTQENAIYAPTHHLLLDGTRGNGKSEAQLARFYNRVGMGYGDHWRGIIFDRRYKDLDDLVIKSKRLFSRFKDGGRFKEGKGDYKWIWPSGEELLFRVAHSPEDYWSYHGQEFSYIAWNELTKYPNSELYDAMMSCNRSSYVPAIGGKEIPLEVISTTNPWGAGHSWVKQRFITPAPPGKYVRTSAEIFNPRTQKMETITKFQLRLFGSYKENIYLAPEYVLELDRIKDPNKRAAWIEGSWDITSGGMFDDLWRSDVHVLEDFVLPKSWRISRALDWGSSRPFSVGWFAEPSDEPAFIKGQPRCFPRGSTIQFDEWYGWNGEPNKGLRMNAKDVALKVKERDNALAKEGYYVNAGPADSSIFDRIDENSIASNMEKGGVTWEPAYKGAGSRINGWEHIRGLLQGAMEGDGEAGFWVTRRCQHTIRTIPTLPRDDFNPDDIDTDAEDHIADMIRYQLYRKPTIIETGRLGTPYANKLTPSRLH